MFDNAENNEMGGIGYVTPNENPLRCIWSIFSRVATRTLGRSYDRAILMG